VPRPSRADQLTESRAPLCEEQVVHLDAVRVAQRAIPAPPALGRLSALFASLGDPTRLRIIAALTAHELCVCDLAALLGLSESAVSHQLRQLRALNLVRYRREGRLALYAIDDEHVAALYRQAREHIAHAEPTEERSP
jgi:ArsR family transcriptional regulator